jgi:hypothetical protein
LDAAHKPGSIGVPVLPVSRFILPITTTIDPGIALAAIAQGALIMSILVQSAKRWLVGVATAMVLMAVVGGTALAAPSDGKTAETQMPIAVSTIPAPVLGGIAGNSGVSLWLNGNEIANLGSLGEFPEANSPAFPSSDAGQILVQAWNWSDTAVNGALMGRTGGGLGLRLLTFPGWAGRHVYRVTRPTPSVQTGHPPIGRVYLCERASSRSRYCTAVPLRAAVFASSQLG